MKENLTETEFDLLMFARNKTEWRRWITLCQANQDTPAHGTMMRLLDARKKQWEEKNTRGAQADDLPYDRAEVH